jgi:hypothetical protein
MFDVPTMPKFLHICLLILRFLLSGFISMMMDQLLQLFYPDLV